MDLRSSGKEASFYQIMITMSCICIWDDVLCELMLVNSRSNDHHCLLYLVPFF